MLFRCCSLVMSFVLCLAATLVPAKAQVLNELVGEWITRAGPQNAARLEIRNNHDTQDSVYGAGRVAPTTEWAANFVVVYGDNQKCYFYVSLSNNNQEMNIEPKSPGTASQSKC